MLATLSGGFALSSAPAGAFTGFGALGQFGSPPFTLGGVQGIATDKTGDVYVYSTTEGGGSIHKYNAAGEPAEFSPGVTVIEGVGGGGDGESEIAIDNSTGPAQGDIYAANNAVVNIYNSEGSFLGSLSGGEACGVAVDPVGSVYVGFYADTVRKYTPTENPVTNANETASMSGLKQVNGLGICNVAVDGAGNVYAATYRGAINEYDASQFGSTSATGTEIDTSGSTLAVDQSTNDVFVDEGSDIAQYEGTTRIRAFGSLEGSHGVAVNGSLAYVYNGANSEVEAFSGPFELPTVVTGGATEVEHTSAKVSGTVNPEELTIESCSFEYGTATVSEHTTPCDKSGGEITGSAPVTVNAKPEGLEPNKTYHYRLVAKSGGHVNGGSANSFSTPPVATAATEAATEVKALSATLNGKVHLELPGGATYHFVYHEEGGLNEVTPTIAFSGEVEQSVEAAVTGLESEKIYHAELVVELEFEGNPVVVSGGEVEFTTLPPATIVTEAANPIGSESATLNGKVALNIEGAEAKYHFEYGKTVSEKTTTVTLFTGEQTVQVPVNELEPNTVYHARLVGEVEGQPVPPGVEIEFTTSSLATAATAAASNVQAESATLNGTVTLATTDPTNYYFEYEEEETGVFTKTASVPVSGEGVHEVSIDATGLKADLTYNVKLVAEVVGHPPLAEGQLVEFHTAFLAPVSIVADATEKPITRTSAIFSGTINPEQSETTYHFEYEYTKEGQTVVRETPPKALPFESEGEPGTTPLATGPEAIGELTPGATYRYRIVAVNGGGTATSSTREFTTKPPAPPTVNSESALATSPTTAVISGEIDPKGIPTSYILEVGSEVLNGVSIYSTSTFGDVGTTPRKLELPVTGLQAGVMYHFRFVAFGEEGSVPGEDRTFQTPVFPQTVFPPATPQIVPTPTFPPVNIPVPRPTLKEALRACRAKFGRSKSKRVACERKARKRFGSKAKKRKR